MISAQAPSCPRVKFKVQLSKSRNFCLFCLVHLDDGTGSGNSPLSFVNMTVELLNSGKAMNVKLIVFEGDSKLDGALGNLYILAPCDPDLLNPFYLVPLEGTRSRESTRVS